jgi:NitT/TauT family transport system substrate-binding protein/putative hydroxymethylpyrimidine transport system substrate-binding protein
VTGLRRRGLRGALLLAAVALATVAGGCGGSSHELPEVVVALDFVPNAVHAPLYAAVASGADRRHGIRIRIARPGSRPDSLGALLSGRADVGVLDIQDLGIARLKGRDVVGIAALVQRPLGALVAQPGVRRPRDLDGTTVGVSGLPSDPAFVDAIVRHDGGRPRTIRQVTIGFAAVDALLSKRVQAVPAFWNAEGVTLRRRGLPVREFRIDDYGAPPFPEVLLMARRDQIDGKRDVMRRFVAAVQDGAADVRAHPARAAREIGRASQARDLGLVRAQLAAVRPIVDPRLRLDRPVLRRWAAFAARIGILRRAPDVDDTFDFGLTAGR